MGDHAVRPRRRLVGRIISGQATASLGVGRGTTPADSVSVLAGGDGERFRHRLLGEVKIAEDADQRGGAAAGFAPEDVLERGAHPCIGRTSTGPSQAAAALPAHARAASRSVASMIQKPPICSLVSA